MDGCDQEEILITVITLWGDDRGITYDHDQGLGQQTGKVAVEGIHDASPMGARGRGCK